MLSAQPVIRVGHQSLDEGRGDSLPQPCVPVFASQPPSSVCLSLLGGTQDRAVPSWTPLWQLTTPHTHTHTVFEAQEIILRVHHDQYEPLGLSSLSTHSRMP